MERRVAVFVGSLRTALRNLKVAQELIALAPHSLQPEIVEIGQLPPQRLRRYLEAAAATSP